MKNIKLPFAIIGLLALVSLTMPQLKPTNAIENTQINLIKSVQFQKREAETMKPAWYQFFNPTKAEYKLTLQNQKKLLFAKSPKQQQADLLNFEVINISTQNVTLPTQDGSLIMIQEAKNPKGDWQPIEYWNYDWGKGSQFATLSLNPLQSVLITAPKYEGDYKTQIRFKLKAAEQEKTFLYSDSFEASIDLSQFEANPKELPQEFSYLD